MDKIAYEFLEHIGGFIIIATCDTTDYKHLFQNEPSKRRRNARKITA